MKKIGICGVPSDAGAAHLGGRMGPDALRVAGIYDALSRRGYQVQDYGNCQIFEGAHRADDPSARNLSLVTAWNKSLFKKTLETLEAGQIPLTLGGDHAFAVGSIGAAATHCARHNLHLKVLWFDAHADFNSPETSPSGNIHGMPVKILTGHGPQPLLDLLAPQGFVAEQDIIQLGIRAVDASEKILLMDSQICVYDMRHIETHGIEATMQEILTSCAQENIHLHVSFDVDALDPIYAPGVGTTEHGGLTMNAAHLALEMIRNTTRLGSVDIFELNPALDVRNQTAQVMVELMKALF